MFLNNRNIFFFDGIGAFLSALLTGGLLPLFSNHLGLSPQILYFLAAFPVVFMIYSLSCYFFAKEIHKWMLKVIITANSLYCLVSGAVIIFYNNIKLGGIAILLLEIAVIILVVALEIRIYQMSFNSKK